MARTAKPWWRKNRKAWFVTIQGKRHNLGRDRDEAFRRFHALMAEEGQVQPAIKTGTVLTILDLFLDWTQSHRAEETYKWYLKHCQSFAESLPRDLGVDHFKPFHVQDWIDRHPNWSDGSRRGAITAIQRAFRWAQKMGYVDLSPICYMEKPAAGRRDEIITQGEYEHLLNFVRDDAFADLLLIARETGCRPQEALRVEARHVDLTNSRWVFPPHEAKIKSRPRIVYLSEKALMLTQRLMLKNPVGTLFRNSQGRPWCASSVNCRFYRIQVAMGRQRMNENGVGPSEVEIERFALSLNKSKHTRGEIRAKTTAELRDEAARKLSNKAAVRHARKYCLYLFRHSFATRLLEAGVDALTVAILLGHANPAMLSTTYQHLAHSPQFLLEQVRKAN